MPVTRKAEIVLERRYDPRSCRHTINGTPYVLHCHHYMSLYSQLAEDCSMLDGRKLLAECAEDCAYERLSAIFDGQSVTVVADRVAIAQELYALWGLGSMRVVCAGPESGEAELIASHVDHGWIRKWGKRDRPVNSVTCGFIAGMFAAVFGRPARSYSVLETSSIVSGAERSRFEVVAN